MRCDWYTVAPHAIGAQLELLRVERGLSQADVARRMRVHRPVYSRTERGLHLPSLQTIYNFAAALDVCPVRDVLWVLDYLGDP